MADPKPGVEGNVAGKPISAGAQQTIQEVLKTTLHKELSLAKPTVGSIVGTHHGSIIHGSVIYEE